MHTTETAIRVSDADTSIRVRAARARAALHVYSSAPTDTFEPQASDIAELMADLLHLAVALQVHEKDPIDFMCWLARHFYAENLTVSPDAVRAQHKDG